MKKTAFLMLISLTFGGRITDTSEQLPDLSRASVDSIKSITIRRQTAYFTVACSIPTCCYVYVRSDFSITDHSIPVTVYIRPRNNDNCLAVICHMDAPATIVVPSSGTYTFQFSRWGGQTLDTTLTF